MRLKTPTKLNKFCTPINSLQHKITPKLFVKLSPSIHWHNLSASNELLLVGTGALRVDENEKVDELVRLGSSMPLISPEPFIGIP